MTQYRPFDTPDDFDYLEALGIEVHGDPSEVGLRTFDVTCSSGRVLSVTVDTFGRSVTTVLRDGNGDSAVGPPIARLYRENAVKLVLARSAPQIIVTFETGGSAGELRITLCPRITLDETALSTEG